ncbi:unnamed protein product, partial [Tilletia controversa]
MINAGTKAEATKAPLIVNVPNNTGSINLRWPKLPDTAEPDAKSSYEHLFNLAAKYEQARLTISGQST